MNKASVIGSGIGGLAVAIRLRLKGYKVIVFEANSSFGGKAAEIKKKGFRFDKGPSLLTMPEKIDELFYLAKKNPKDYHDCTFSLCLTHRIQINNPINIIGSERVWPIVIPKSPSLKANPNGFA